MIDEFCAGAALIPYSKVTLVQYQTLSKDSTTWKVDVNKLSDVNILQGLWLLFIDKSDHFANKNEEFYNPTVKKVLTVINGMPLQLFASGIKARNIYPELKKNVFLHRSLECQMGRGFNDNIWAMGSYTIQYKQ